MSSPQYWMRIGPRCVIATVGTLLSTFAVGYGMWFVLPVAGLELPLIYCLQSFNFVFFCSCLIQGFYARFRYETATRCY